MRPDVRPRLTGDPEDLRPLLTQALVACGTSAISWWAGAGLPAGTAVEMVRPTGPIDGTIHAGRACGDLTVRLSRETCALLVWIEERRKALETACLQAVADGATGVAAAAAWNRSDGRVVLLPPVAGHTYAFTPEARALLAALEPLLSPFRLPAGTSQALALRQGRAVALVEGRRAAPLFHLLP